MTDELLLDLWYFRNLVADALPARVNYCLVCGTSETGKHFAAGGDQVNYYLVCGTSET